MIDSEYYKNYNGSSLVKVEIWCDKNNKTNITEYMNFFYGQDNNWNGVIYKYKEIFSDYFKYHQFYMEFQDDNKQKKWFYGIVGEPEQYFHPPTMR